MPHPVSKPPQNVDLGDLSPWEAAARLRHLLGLAFFDSALETGAREQISIVTAAPTEVIEGDLFRDFTKLQEAIRSRTMTPQADNGLPRGFAAGYVEYDGRFRFGIYERALFYRHHQGTWEDLGGLSEELREESAIPVSPDVPPLFVSRSNRDEYCARVRRAQEYIAAGDIYQVNIAHRFDAAWQGDPMALYEALRDFSPTPYAAYLDAGNRAVLSASPELFLKMSGRFVRTRPIKGTRPRRTDRHADEKSAYDLLTSPKEIAELVMITDLERSDLGQVCETGTVAVRELLALERYEQVFHLVSTVEGQLRPEVDHVSALRACFPGGSITGAPKKRAREVITELEPDPRGLYTGAIGWFGFNGESQFNIAIRTVVVEPESAHFYVGAGIVADSIPEKEWQETLDKAEGILAAARNLTRMGS